MPLYEYLCRECDRRFERLVRTFNEEVACPACQSAAVEKQLSVFAMAGGAPRASAPGASGGCCGGGCGCAH